MNEAIGSKGGHSDRKRSMSIRNHHLNKLKQYHQQLQKKRIRELEKKVKKIQIITFLQTVPLLLSFSALRTIVRNTSSNFKPIHSDSYSKLDIKKSNQKRKEKNKTVIENREIYPKESILSTILVKREPFIKVIKKRVRIKEPEKEGEKIPVVFKQNSLSEDKNDFSKERLFVIPITLLPKESLLDKKEKKEQTEEIEEQSDLIESDIIDNDLLIPQQELNKIEEKKLVEKYEKDLKVVRTGYKEIASSYDGLEDAELKQEALFILDKVNEVIDKLEELKKRIKVDKDGYQEYYYEMIEKYTYEFSQSRAIDHIKDSDLYILISKKIKVMDDKRKELLLDLKEKETSSKKTEENKEYFLFDQYKKKVEQIQEDSKKITKDVEKEIKQLKRKIDIDKRKVNALSMESILLLSFLSSSFLQKPSIRNAKVAAVTTLTSIYFMNQILKDKYDFSHTKKLKQEEYQKEIEANIKDIDDVIDLVMITNQKIDELVLTVKNTFPDYELYPELRSLLDQLDKVKKEMKEKEFEIYMIKEKQEKSYQKKKGGSHDV